MTIARRLILLLAVPLLAFLAMGAFTGLELARIETSTRFVADFRIAARRQSET